MSKRLISLILVLVLFTTALISCKKEPEGEITETDTEVQTEAPPPFYEIAAEELANYMIVYSADASQDVIDATTNLAAAFSMKFGVALRARDDAYIDSTGNPVVGEYEILIGNTNRPESQQFLSELEYQDRGYKVIGKKIVIAAHDPFITANTVNEFSSFVRKTGKDVTVFFNTDMDHVVRGSYTFDTITVNGGDISDYQIVYPKGKSFERALANKLRRVIAEQCGSMLTVTADNAEPTEREILIGKTNRAANTAPLAGVNDGRGYLALDGNKLVLCGNTALGNATATDALIDLLTDGGSSDVLELHVENGLKTDANGASEFSAMTFNVGADGINAGRKQRVVETIVRYLPDTIGLQECSAEWKKYLTEQLGDYYEYVGVGRDADGTGLASAILYAKEKLTLKESATKWLSATPDEVSKLDQADANYTYTWAKLERKDGESFILLNTQLGTNSVVRTAQARMLLEFMWANKDTAIVLTGDLNCTEGSEEMNTLLCEFMRHSAVIAEEKQLGSQSANKLSDTVLVYDKFIDVTVMKVAADRIDGMYASKSNAAYIEFLVDYNGTEYTESGITSNGQLNTVPDRDGEEYDPFIPFT